MDASLSKPSRIGAYDIVDVIGRGGMGTVFRGNDPRIGRPVAIKVLTAAAEDPDLLLRFYREAKYTGSLHHQNIVTVYELGHQDSVPYLVMEYLEGISLEAMIASGRQMAIAEKLGIILQVCNGLTYAHKHGLVHRDIKPANIVILEDGTPKIVDFGIALLGGSRLTRTGHVVGSLNYMSPEQLSGNMEVDARTDVYSTGVVLYQLLTGVLPFDGGSTAATLRKIVTDPPPPLSKYLPDCPPDLEGIIEKALAKNREERYSSPEDFGLDLARVHQQYMKNLLAETLQQAGESLKRKEFTTARQQVLQVLRAAPHNQEAADLLRQVKQGQEQQQREQQILQLQMKAEEAVRKNQLVEAQQYVDQGMQLDPEGGVFAGLRDAIAEAQARTAKYKDALKRAESALRNGDLESAKRSVEEAQAIFPDDPGARAVAGQIIARLEQQLQEQKAAERQRQFARTINMVEKAMADARMMLFLGQIEDALRALGKIESDVAQLPPQWMQQFEALKQEAKDKQEGKSTPPETDWDNLGGQTADLPAPTNATRLMQPPVAPAELTNDLPQPGFEPRFGVSTGTRPVAPPELPSFRPAENPQASESKRSGDILRTADFGHDVLHHRTGTRERGEVAPELREFLEPEPRTWSRSTILTAVAVALLAMVLVWLFVRPGPQSQSHATAPGAVSGYSYAEINAEPWATVTAIDPANSDAQKIIGQQTPLRAKLPPGHYSVTLQGPNHEQKQVSVSVPQQGGTASFTVFQKPDLNKIVGKD
jgi:tetratricopeptide (TPR) repeat protein